jgi:beta-barrel assembly-enhancing protease
MSLALGVLTSSAALSQTKRSHSNEDLNVIGHRTLVKGPNFYSLDKERDLGRLLAQEVERSSKLIADPVVTEYLIRLGENLAKNSDAKFPITIRLMDSNEINAFTLPGGYQYVNKGLILATRRRGISGRPGPRRRAHRLA